MARPKKPQPAKTSKAKLELKDADVKEFERIIQEVSGEDHSKLAVINPPQRLSEMKALTRRSTGLLSLDIALGGRGLADGLQYELSALESVGKTQRTLRIIGRYIFQSGRPGLLLDLEGTIDPEWASSQIYDEAVLAGASDEEAETVADNFLINQPLTSEVARMEAMLAIKHHYCAVCIDSVGAVEPDDVYQGMETGSVSSRKGAQAGFMSQTCRSLTNSRVRYASPTQVIWINQLRTGGNMMAGRTYLETMGGKALRYFASARIQMKPIEFNQQTGERKVRFQVLKNKIGPPFGECEVWVCPDGSVDPFSDLVQSLFSVGLLVSVGGGYYNLDGERLNARGYEEIVGLLSCAKPKVREKLVARVVEEAARLKFKLTPERDEQ